MRVPAKTSLRWATSLAQARVMIAERAPACVVLDLHLPNVDGSTILKAIHSNERFTQTAVILATADAQMADGLRGKADLVLLKTGLREALEELDAGLVAETFIGGKLCGVGAAA